MYSYRFRGAPAPNFSAHQDSDNLGKWTHYFPLSEAIYSGVSSERLYVHELFPWDGMPSVVRERDDSKSRYS